MKEYQVDESIAQHGACMLVLECAYQKETFLVKSLKTQINHTVRDIEENISLDQLENIEAISKFKNIMRILGWNPNRYRISSEALFRRIIQGKGMYFINPIVDLNNYMCLFSYAPVGSYDLARLGKKVVMRCGAEREVVSTISKGDFDFGGSIVLADDIGIFGSPINDSKRCMIKDDTTDFAMFFYSMTPLDKNKILEEFERVTFNAGIDLKQATLVG